MPGSKAKGSANTSQTRNSPSIASKLASKMATADSGGATASSGSAWGEAEPPLSMTRLIIELEKQRTSLREDMSVLIQTSVTPLQSSVDSLRDVVNNFQGRLAATEALAGENFALVNANDTAIKSLQTQNRLLLDRIDDLENRTRRANLRIINIPEGSETGKDPSEFIAGLLTECVGPGVFDKPPELERAHRSLAPKPKAGVNARPFVVCFHRFQEREKVLRWARQNELKYRGVSLRVYPDLSAATARKRAAFNDIKQVLYRKKIKFRLLMFPVRLQISHGDETLTFDTPDGARKFYEEHLDSA